MRKFYWSLVIVFVTQFAVAAYSLEDSWQELEFDDDAAMIEELERIGKVVYNYSETRVHGVTVARRPSGAYFQIRRDAVEVALGKEHLEMQEYLLRGVSLFALGGFISSLGIFCALLDKLSRRSVNIAVGVLGLEAVTAAITAYGANKLADQWQIMPECVNIEPRKIIKEEFWHLYPEGSKLPCSIEQSWAQAIGYPSLLLSGIVLGGLCYWQMLSRSR